MDLYFVCVSVAFADGYVGMDPRTRLDKVDSRAIPPFVQKALAIDVDMTKRFVAFCLNFVPIRSLKTNCKFLEVSKLRIQMCDFSSSKEIPINCLLFLYILVLMPWRRLVGWSAGHLLDLRQPGLL